MSSPEVRAAALQFVHSQTISNGGLVIKKSEGARSLKGVLRLHDADLGSVVVKIWRYNNLRDRLSRLVGQSNSCREWTIHCFASRQRLAVPEPLSFNSIRIGAWQSVDLMVVRDLTESRDAMSYLKQVLANADESAIGDFEDRVIRLTAAFVDAGITDIDHQLNNMLVDECGALFRIDFECARRHRNRRLREHDLGVMLGRLICTHVYACQPHLDRTVVFARSLVQALKPSDESLAVAKHRINHLLQLQLVHAGINSAFVPPW